MGWAIFDIETRVDKRLLNESFFRDREVSEEEAYEEFRKDLLDRYGTDFFPLSLHVPVSIAVGWVDRDYALRSVESLGGEGYGEEIIVREFWDRVERFQQKRRGEGRGVPGGLISFNGRMFDLPVLELHALRHGCVAPSYFNGDRYGPRSRFGDGHYDLQEFITNYGAFRIRGGFDLLQRLIGLPGKGDIDGSQVQELWEAGRLDEINRYCRRDVIQTYLLFLRVEVVRGRIDRARAEELTADGLRLLESES